MTNTQKMEAGQLVFMARLAVAAALLIALFIFVPFDQLRGTFASMRIAPLTAALVAGILVQVSVALRVQPLLRVQGLRFTLAHVLAVNLSTNFYGLVLPGGNLAGILIRLYRFGGQQANYSGAVVMLVADRLFATGSMCAVGVLALLLDWPEIVRPVLALLLAAMLITLAGPLAISAYFLPTHRLEVLPGRRLRESATRLVAALRLARSLSQRAVIRVSILALVAQVLGTLVYWFVAVASNIEISLTTMMWVRSAALLAAIVPISIAGLGVREGAFVVLLSDHGIAGADGVAISLTGFAFTSVLAALLGGVLEAWRMSRPRQDL